MATMPERSHSPPEAHDDTDGRTILGEAMAARVEPPTVTVWVTARPQLVRRTTVPGAQRRQRLAAILPESFYLAF